MISSLQNSNSIEEVTETSFPSPQDHLDSDQDRRIKRLLRNRQAARR
jgi:hypothetical protein